MMKQEVERFRFMKVLEKKSLISRNIFLISRGTKKQVLLVLNEAVKWISKGKAAPFLT